MLNTVQIQKITGRKADLALLDQVQEQKEDSLVAISSISGSEAFFQGHFPDNPVVPGVLIVETMAQACQVLLDNQDLSLSQIRKARFREMVRPGDQLVIKVKEKSANVFAAEAYLNEKVACSAELTFA